jgi:imidazolonepropionase-like amidohydrolase
LDTDARSRYEHSLIKHKKHNNSTTQRLRVEKDMALQAAFWRAGGKLTVGTDPTVVGALAGHGSLVSIEMLVEAGIPPLAAIKIATQNGAEAMGVEADRGTLALGKRADLIVINGDPSADISAIHNVEIVFKQGVGYDPKALQKSAVGRVGGPG